MTVEEVAAYTLLRKLGFRIRVVSDSGDRGTLEHQVVDEHDKLIAHSCRPVYRQEIAMWQLLVELQARVDVLESELSD